MKEVVVVCLDVITRHSLKKTERIQGTLARYVSAEQTCQVKQKCGTKLVS
jgi:hypothetical protein